MEDFTEEEYRNAKHRDELNCRCDVCGENFKRINLLSPLVIKNPNSIKSSG